jgi:chemotaxis protein histidine kinase CheA
LPLRLIFAVPDPIEMDLLFPYNRDKVRPLFDPAVVMPELGFAQTKLTSAEVAPDIHSRNKALPHPTPQAPAAKAPASPGQTTATLVIEDSIRVNVGVLKRFMNLAVQLVLGRNQLRTSIA